MWSFSAHYISLCTYSCDFCQSHMQNGKPSDILHYPCATKLSDSRTLPLLPRRRNATGPECLLSMSFSNEHVVQLLLFCWFSKRLNVWFYSSCHSCTLLFRESVCFPVWRCIGMVIGVLVGALKAAAEVKGGANAGLPVLLQQDFGLWGKLSAVHAQPW